MLLLLQLQLMLLVSLVLLVLPVVGVSASFYLLDSSRGAHAVYMGSVAAAPLLLLLLAT